MTGLALLINPCYEFFIVVGDISVCYFLAQLRSIKYMNPQSCSSWN